ncbi:MAG: galactokinase [Sphingobacteriia bacterium 28-36-52]|jgi:galactokinase|uniref:galactokinase n=1 Tax=Sediminibacterium sp. TaxID=1917865 RepID=UPI000BD18B29|nr:galactokinase [Sediminibacterium sp.]OYY08859.1 MAG: galactokinase [Sphingobacteriia bacterium 35-36-14]OYZ02107.1 MAG: galactokinase [Sphingobacteriia bacterium 28-36-52]OYZ54266.1 MAG: galactokinase [Sphingobacteriia bacterium 24-36-13]HQS23769.1 galactokinase [Sediminibacterium sp.]HQS34024.1 galactokinase [Sediminibacterium sp.]
MKTQLAQYFFEQYHHQPTVIVRSPGRVNIIGEHADYNNGFVLPAAIDKAAYLAVSLRDDQEIHLTALDLNEKFSTTVDELKPIGDVSWPNYILGSAAQFLKHGIQLPGFNAVLTSNVPIGAGLSSSAAVECATVFALNHLLKTNIERVAMVAMAQKAEHEYAGVMCGIMDQFASMMGKANQVIKLDCRSLEYEYVPFKLDGIKILLLNTNVKHSLASSEYNTRRLECMQAVEMIQAYHPEVQSLRDATVEMLDQYVLPFNDLVYQRSRFVVDEMERLNQACQFLQDDNIPALGNCMFKTHDGLSRQYEVSCKELDYLVDFVRSRKEVIGARMMGGGFGGCTINLVQEDKIESLINSIKPAYEEAMGLPLDYYIATIQNGTEII